jgi:hypothetical protein
MRARNEEIFQDLPGLNTDDIRRMRDKGVTWAMAEAAAKTQFVENPLRAEKVSFSKTSLRLAN